MAQSLADNEKYWEDLFEQLGYIPAWFEKAIGGIPQNEAGLPDPAQDPEHRQHSTTQPPATSSPNTPFYESRFEGTDRFEDGKVIPFDPQTQLDEQAKKEFAESLTTNAGLLAAQEAMGTSASTWNINMYTNISGAGTEEVNDKIEEEIKNLPDKLDDIIEQKVKKKFERVNPRG